MAERVSWFRKLRQAVDAFWDESTWSAKGKASRLHRFAQFCFLVWKSFNRNRCPVRASALSYATLLALIPLLAVAISVTSSLLKDRGEQAIYKFIDRIVSEVVPPSQMETNPPATTASLLEITNNPPLVTPVSTNDAAVAVLALTNVPPDTAATFSNFQAEVSNPEPPAGSNDRVATAQKEAAHQINGFIRNVRSGTLGVTGMIGIIMVAILLLARIEETFNDIWGVTRGRSWTFRVGLYWTAITLGPPLVTAAVVLASGHHLNGTREALQHTAIGGFLFQLLPILVLWFAMLLFYKLVPNTPVDWAAAAVGGIVAAVLWHVLNLCGFLYVSRVVTYNKIYGGIGLVPVFMVGLYFAWFILLLGAQVAYAYQNRELYAQNKLAENVNQRGREFVALRLMTCLGQRFLLGQRAPTVQEMSGELGVPSRLVQQVLQTLLAAHLVTECSGAESAYAPARPLEHINAHHVLMAMRATRGQELLTRDEPVRAEVFGEYARIEEAEKTAASAVSLLALVTRAQARVELSPAPNGTEGFMPALVPKELPAGPCLAEDKPAAKAETPAQHVARPHAEPAIVTGVVVESSGKPIAEPVLPKSAVEPNDKKTAIVVASPIPDEERDFPL